MKVLFVSAEVSPFAKVGGLADVAGSLPKALHALGHDVRIVMPAYQMVLDDPRWNITKVWDGLEVSMNRNWKKPLAIYETHTDGVPVYLLATDDWFCNADKSEHIYGGGGDPYLFFSCAVLEAAKALNFTPDVMHCNDWHTGLLPCLLRERDASRWADTATVFSIHNLAYQGEFGFEILDRLELPHRLFNADQLETYGGVNFLKSGCVFSDAVNTVSPKYAEEIQTPAFGCKLEGLMRHLAVQDRLYGILNGIDLEEFDPATDIYTTDHFSQADMSGKARCRAALLKEMGLEPIENTPVMGVVSRLSHQKGMDLMIDAADELLSIGQLIVLGSGDSNLAAGFKWLAHNYPNRVGFHEGFDLGLAPRIYAGSDMFLMPSAFEPCGLGQLIAMRYGTVPVVRSTGGLANTVFDEENGFVFYDNNSEAFLSALRRAKAAYVHYDRWRELERTCMETDCSWTKSAVKYEEMYTAALGHRRAKPSKALRA